MCLILLCPITKEQETLTSSSGNLGFVGSKVLRSRNTLTELHKMIMTHYGVRPRYPI